MKILIIGISGGTNIGGSFLKAANNLGISSVFKNRENAYQAPRWLKLYNWHIRGKYPSKLKKSEQELLRISAQFCPQYLLTTGITPISQTTLQKIGSMGVQRINFLTDDPWNPAHYAPWFLKALPHYDIVFSPRHAVISDLLNLGCRQVEYLPFAYDLDLFYPEKFDQVNDNVSMPDIVFAGGADRDRIPYISALIKAGFQVDLYGGYWERYPETRTHTRGQADVPTLRKALSSAKIGLCLVRRANRDGHCMRTFEVPAVGTCMLTEDTQEHRDIFGSDGEAVMYFSDVDEMIQKARWLLDNDTERERLAQTAHQLITQGKHTYRDRLKTIISYIA
ncbi:CgeB family protein [Moorena producens]|uniref:CgeB family protein n=1 Tax=Moorena producens TaxID=1155739 RepID=UPI003C76D988